MSSVRAACFAVDRACADLVKLQNVKDFRFELRHPLDGLADGAGSDTYSLQQAYALIIDIAGDDTYYAGAATTSAAVRYVLIDTSGNDRYLESPELDNVQVRDFSNRKVGQLDLTQCCGDGLYLSGGFIR